MKRLMKIGAMALMVMAMSSTLKAQDCEYIVSFKYGKSMNKVSPAKIDYWCRVNSNTLFVTNDVPTGATVFSISELREYRTGMHLPTDFVVNLDSLSLFRYDFSNFQDLNKTVYFLTEGSEYRYLGVKGYTPSMNDTGEPDKRLDIEWDKELEQRLKER